MVPGASLEGAEARTFQTWFRDLGDGSATSDSTDGLRVTFAR